MSRISTLYPLCACLLVLSTNLCAQTATAELVDTVTDSSGAGIPKAKVTITSASTNLVIREKESDSTGAYHATLIPPGDYTISVEASGFRKLVQSGIKLETNQRARIDLPLQVGQVSETVEVSATTPLLESQSSSLGAVIGESSSANCR